MIQGERILIRPTNQADLPDLIRLWNDGRVMRWVGFPEGLGYTAEDIANWYRALQKRSNRWHFVVHSVETGFCGEIHYTVDRLHKRAGLDIKFVPEAQGRGLATDALKTLICHVFEREADVEAVWTEPREENQAARRLYTRCGLVSKLRPADMASDYDYWELSRGDWEMREV
jgi:RimJ/RimL family protein N-acetyltransferase